MRHLRIRSSTRRAAAAILVAGLLAGCTTAAQRQYQAMSTNNQAVGTEAKACLAQILSAPEAAPLLPHGVGQDPTQATIAQLSDPALATPLEIAAVNALHPQYKACQRAIVAGLYHSMPSAASILERAYAAGDDDIVLLTQRKISWGEVMHRARDRGIAAKAALIGEGQQITAGLEQRHEAELARRQAAADAIARAARENAAISAMQMQQLNNRSINCTYGGGYMSCN